MNRCATCKHWQAPTAPVLWGECQRIDDYVDVNNPLEVQVTLAYMPEAASGDDPTNELPYAHLFTQPTFGCVLWEAA